MNLGERFWYVITCAAVLWYSTITVYVAIRGASDIKSMLRRLAGEQSDDESEAELPR